MLLPLKNPLFVIVLLAAVSVPGLLRWHSLRARTEEVRQALLTGNDEDGLRLANGMLLNNNDDVMVHFLRAVMLRPRRGDDWIELVLDGRAVHESTDRNNLLQMKQEYRSALRIDPSEDGCWHNLGWVEALLGDRESALEDVAKAVQLESTDSTYRVSYGLLLEGARKDDWAAVQYGQAIRLRPVIVDSQFFKSLMQRNPELSRRSLASAVEALSGDRGSPISEAKLGALHARANQWLQADQEVKEGLNALPTMGGAWLTLAQIQVHNKEFNSADQSLRRAQFLMYDQSRVLDSLGDLRYSEGKGLDAEQYWIRARAQLSSRISSQHSVRVRTQFVTAVPLANDMMPRSLLGYVTPDVLSDQFKSGR